MDFELPEHHKQIIEFIKWLAKEKLRPLGLEFDKKEEPIPPDHPFFYEIKAMGIEMGMFSGGKEGKEDRDNLRERMKRFGISGDFQNPMLATLAVVGAEILAWGDQGVAMSFPGPGLASPPIRIMANDYQREIFNEVFKKSEKPVWGAFGLTEPGAGSDVARIRTTARKEGNYYVLNGEKMYITNGARAEWVVVFATVDPKLGRAGHRAFLVRKGTPGFKVSRIEKKMGLHASETAGLVFEECKVPAELLLGGEEYYKSKEGFKGAMETLNMTRPAVASMAIGIARAAYEYTRDYFAENYMLNAVSPLAVKIKSEIERMKRKLDLSRWMCLKAAYLMDMKRPNAKEASEAKAYVPPIALDVISKCIELLGEEGTLEYHHIVHKAFRDIKVFDIFEGTGQAQRIVISKRLFTSKGKPAEWIEQAATN